MTVFNINKTAIFTLLFISFALSAMAYTTPDPIGDIKTDTTDGLFQDFSKAYNRTFNVSKNTTVVLSNKYGAVDVHTGNGSQVIVKIKVTVSAASQLEANKVFERVNITFLENPEFVKAETNIETQAKSGLFTDPPPSNDFRIDYDVTMPASNKLDISNRHGNTTIAAMTNAVKIDQKYGDFRLDGASSATVVLAYGGGQLSNLNFLNGSVSYGRLTSPNIGNGRIKSIYSQFRFDNVGSLDLISSYDTYEINDVTNLKANCKYGSINAGNVENLNAIGSSTGFKIQKIENNADFESTYGTIRVGSVKNGFATINVKGDHTNCIIVIDPSVNYRLDVDGSNTNVRQPASMRVSINRDEHFRREIMGIVGNNPNTKSTIRVHMNYGEFRIK